MQQFKSHFKATAHPAPRPHHAPDHATKPRHGNPGRGIKPSHNRNNHHESFSYSVTFPDGVAFGETETRSLQIQESSDFLLSHMAVEVIYSDDVLIEVPAGEHLAGILCQIADGATQAPLSNIPLPICSIFGCGKNPRVLPHRRLLEANSVLIFTLSNIYTVGNTGAITITLDGEKVFTGGAA